MKSNKRMTLRFSCTEIFVQQHQSCHGTGEAGNLNVNFSKQGEHGEFAKIY